MTRHSAEWRTYGGEGLQVLNIFNSKRAQLISRIKEKESCDAFVEAEIVEGIPLQIRAMQTERGWTQEELGDRAGMKQSQISQLEQRNYSGYTLRTLLRLASAFDVGLQVSFVPISELVDKSLAMRYEDLAVPDFGNDAGLEPQYIRKS